MRLILTGKILRVGSDCCDSSPSVTVLLKPETEDEEAISLECDLSEENAIKLAPHLYGDMRITLEVISKPKLVEGDEA